MAEDGELTRLLHSWTEGDETAMDELAERIYGELRKMAGRALRRERSEHTLQATALVHEAFMRLLAQDRIRWRNRSQFLGISAQLMRRILVDHARRRQAAKREAGLKITLGDDVAAADSKAMELLMLDRALARLQEIDLRQARIVEMRYFAGLKIEETAEVLGVSVRTVKRDWTLAKAWLRREIAGDRGGAA